MKFIQLTSHQNLPSYLNQKTRIKMLIFLVLSLVTLCQAVQPTKQEITIGHVTRTIYSCRARLTRLTPCDIVLLGFESNTMLECPMNEINQKCNIYLIGPSTRPGKALRYQSFEHPLKTETKFLMELLWFNPNGLSLRRGGTFIESRDQGDFMARSIQAHLNIMDQMENTQFLSFYTQYVVSFIATTKEDWIPFALSDSPLSSLPNFN